MKVYLDNASTTGVTEEVLEVMLPFFKEEFGNPSSLHKAGIRNKKVVNNSRTKIAELLNCKRSEIFFTSCGTESINWAIKGIASNNKTKSDIITTRVEHHATLNSCKYLEERGYTLLYVDVDKEGFIDLNHLRSLVSENTLIVSLIMANNEIGTIQNVKEISDICIKASTYLHIDAVQAICHTSLNINELNVDLLSISGHKFHGPKGIGLLYIKEGTKIAPLIHGGQQEQKLRAGTENIAFIAGMAKALEIGLDHLESYQERLNTYSRMFLKRLDEAKIDYLLNGPEIGEKRLPGNLNLSFKGIDGTSLEYLLNRKGIYTSTGSACDSQSIEPSHVLVQIKVPEDYINATIRFSLGSDTTFEELNYVIDNLIHIVKKEI